MKTRSTKRALMLSLLSLMLCVSMLVGSTYAWFTDSVTSSNNIIKSGKLDVEMYWAEGKADPADTATAWTDASNGAIFNNDKWEPGYTEVRHIKIANEGTLALKYQLNILPNGPVEELAEVIDVYFIDPAEQVADRTALKADDKVGTLDKVLAGMPANTSGTLLAGKEAIVTIALKMQETAGNEYQDKSIGTTFDIQLLATQLTYEEDSFDKNYDEDATLGTYIELDAGADLLAAMASAEADMPLTIVLNGNVEWPTDGHHGENDVTPASSITIIGNGNTITATGSGVTPLGDTKAPMTLKNVKIVDNSVSYNEGSWEFTYLEMGGTKLVCENVTFADEIQTGTEAIFTNCSFESNEENVYAVWVEDGSATFNNCTFTGYRGIKAHEEYGSEISSVVVKDCTFQNITKKPGIAIGSIYMNGDTYTTGGVTYTNTTDTTVSITGSTFINCQPGDQTKYIYETDTDVTTFNFVEKDNVVLNGNAVAEGVYYEAAKKTFTVSSKEGLMNLGQELIKVAPNEANVQTVNLVCDVNLSGEDWTPLSSMWVKFNGNGHTISNLTAGFDSTGRRSGFWGYAGAVTISNLNLHNVSVAGSQVGAFAGSGDGLKMEGCVLSGNNTITYVDGVEDWNGVGAITGTLYNSTVNATIAEGATVQLIKEGFTTDSGCIFQDNLTGYLQANNGTVINNGTVTVIDYTIATAEQLLALGGKSLEGTIVLDADIDLNGAAVATIGAAYGKNLTIIGNGHTISNAKTAHTNHNGMKHHGMFYAYTNSNLTISDLKIEGVTIDATADTERNYGAAIVVAYADGGSTVNLNNVDIANCNVLNNTPDIGDEAGVYVGYQTGTLVMTDCDSTGCTVAGETTEKTGAFIGMVNGTATLNNCTTDLTIGACNRVAGTLTIN